MEVKVFGAGLDVGRSCFLLTISQHYILLDCGAHHGFADGRRFPDFSTLPVGVLSRLDAVLISHFHFDHAGALPLLTAKFGCCAPIYMTEPTRELTRLMLLDSCATSAVRGQHCPFSESDVNAALSRVQLLHTDTPVHVKGAPDVVVTALHAGHTLGAVMLHVRVANLSVLYSGDYSLRPDRVLPFASVPSCLKPNLFITEATYCNSERACTWRDGDADMSDAIIDTLKRRGKVLIPISAFGRVHAVCAALISRASGYHLHEIPMYVTSGLATDALAVYERFALEWTVQIDRNPPCIQCASRDASKSMRKRSRFTSTCSHGLIRNLRPFNRNENWHVIDVSGPIILFATPGSLSSGVSRDVFKVWSTDADNLVVMPSAAFATSVASNSSTLPNVRCKTVNMAVACHPDKTDILRMCRHVDPRSIMLVHGEKTKVLAFREHIEQLLKVRCFAPANGGIVRIPDDLLKFLHSEFEKLPKPLQSSLFEFKNLMKERKAIFSREQNFVHTVDTENTENQDDMERSQGVISLLEDKPITE